MKLNDQPARAQQTCLYMHLPDCLAVTTPHHVNIEIVFRLPGLCVAIQLACENGL